MIIENIIPQNTRIYADKNLMTIVCNNLIGNALKYGTQDGKIVIEAKHAGDYLNVNFYNDGKPIPQDHSQDLFKKYFRLPDSDGIKGTGLGLFIVKEIIEKHGGKIWIEPKEKGNAFLFTLLKR